MGPGLFRWRAALSAGSLVLAMALLTAVTLLLSPSAGVAAAVSRERMVVSFQTEETKEGLSAAVQASTQPPAPSLLPAQAQSKNKTETKNKNASPASRDLDQRGLDASWYVRSKAG